MLNPRPPVATLCNRYISRENGHLQMLNVLVTSCTRRSWMVEMLPFQDADSWRIVFYAYPARWIDPWKLTWISKIAIFERRYVLKKPSFLVSMLNFWGVHFLDQVMNIFQKNLPHGCPPPKKKKTELLSVFRRAKDSLCFTVFPVTLPL